MVAVDPFELGLKVKGGKTVDSHGFFELRLHVKAGTAAAVGLSKLGKAHRGTILLVRNSCGPIC